jgi:hypothetical protein
MKVLRTIIKVSFQNLVIVLAWLLLAPFVAMLINPLPWWLFFIVFIVLAVPYFLLLFFSNAELFKWAKNDYVWSLCTGVLTLFGFIIPSMMWVSHNNLYEVLQSAFT